MFTKSELCQPTITFLCPVSNVFAYAYHRSIKIASLPRCAVLHEYLALVSNYRTLFLSSNYDVASNMQTDFNKSGSAILEDLNMSCKFCVLH